MRTHEAIFFCTRLGLYKDGLRAWSQALKVMIQTSFHHGLEPESAQLAPFKRSTHPGNIKCHPKS
jgi:hypothetical protein